MAERLNTAKSCKAQLRPELWYYSARAADSTIQRVPLQAPRGTLPGLTPACGFNRSQPAQRQGPLVGEAAAKPWAEAASEIEAWVLRFS